MATPTARFTITFDAETGGIERSKSALDGLRSTIERDTKALADMGAAMQRLKGNADVMRWEALPKDIVKAESEVAKLEKQMAKLKAAFEVAPAGKKEGIFAAGLSTQGDLNKATARLAGLREEQGKLARAAPVLLFEDLKESSEKTASGIAKAQTALSRLGGTMGEVSATSGGLASLGEAAQQVPGPVGSIASKFQQLKALGPAAAVVAVTVAFIALGVVIAKSAWELTKFALFSADAARSAMLLRTASAVGSASARDLEGAMLRVEGKTAATREAVSGLVEEYSRLRLTLGAIEGATSAVTVATQAAGQAAGATIKGLIDRGVDTKRFWLNALDLKGTGVSLREVSTQLAKQMKVAVGAAESALRDGRVKLEDGIKALDAAVEARFGEVARRQMLALPVQLDRARKNLAGIFKDVNVEGFLGKLRDVLSLLDETSETGKSLRVLGKAIFQPLVDGASAALPFVEGAIYGVIYVAQTLVIWGLKAQIALKKVFGGSSIFKDIDLMKLGFQSAVGVAAGFITVLVALGAIVAGVALSFALVTAPIWGTIAAVIALATHWDEAIQAISDAVGRIPGDIKGTAKAMAGAVGEIIEAIYNAIKNGVGRVAEAITGLADSAVGAFNKALLIRSPSKRFERQAFEIPQGTVKGVEKGRPLVAAALASLADPNDMGGGETGALLAQGGRGGNTIYQIELNYHGAGSRSDAQRFVQYLHEELETLTLAKGLPA